MDTTTDNDPERSPIVRTNFEKPRRQPPPVVGPRRRPVELRLNWLPVLAPVGIAAVLVGSEMASSASRYYASRYYSAPERTGWLRRRPVRTHEQ